MISQIFQNNFISCVTTTLHTDRRTDATRVHDQPLFSGWRRIIIVALSWRNTPCIHS